MVESKMQTIVVSGRRGGKSARILTMALQELVYAHRIIEIAINTLPRDAMNKFIAQLKAERIEGEGSTRHHERKLAIETAISVMAAYPLPADLKAAGWPLQERFSADKPMPPRWARLVFTGNTLVVATFGFDAFSQDEQYFIRLTVQRGTGELEHMEHYYADPMDQAWFDTVAATKAQEFVRFLQEYGGTGKGLRTLESVDAAAVAGSWKPAMDLIAHLQRQRTWSQQTFGPGDRTAGVLDHLRKELLEVEAAPGDVSEWIDVAILAFDGAMRAGHSPAAVAAALQAKQERNEARTWPDWRTLPVDQAIEHDRSGETAEVTHGQ